ncbi:unnamed protein product [Mucor hiemalis]
MTQDNHHNFIVEYVNSHSQFNNESNDMKLNNSTTFIYQDGIDLVGFIPNNNTLPQSPDPHQYDNPTTSPSSAFQQQQQHFPSPSPSPYHASTKPVSTFYPNFFQEFEQQHQQQQQQQYSNDFIINHTTNKTKEHTELVEETEDLILPNNRNISSSSSSTSSSSSASSTNGSVIHSAPPPKPGKIVNSELRRQIHIQSEQKRRAQIKDGFEDLRNELPSCLNKKMSKVALLHRTVQHIQHLKNTQMTIYAELERLASENEQLRKFQETVLQKQSLEKIYSSH